jgi:Fur family peroxide stress response transcriptional regulator
MPSPLAPSPTPKLQSAPAAGGTADLLAALKEAGLRLTPQRIAVCRALAETLRGAHPTAQALYAHLLPAYPSLSRATIYNTLQTLVNAGLVHELGTAGDGTLHYDIDASPHANLVCTRCHRVEDFPAAALAGVAQRVASASGYELRGARIVYYGLCPACRREIKAKARARGAVAAGKTR